MKLKKATALLLAGVMTFSLAGCGGQTESAARILADWRGQTT